MISARNVSYGSILHDISLELPERGVTGIVGPNGSGKTTLLRLLFGALKPTTGQVVLNGRDLRRYSAREIAQNIAVVAQEFTDPPALTVADVVRLGRLPHGDQGVHIIAETLTRLGLDRLATRPVAQLSGGEFKRVMIARAWVQETPHVLLDEPTNHLDIFHQLEVLKQVTELDAGVAVVLHDLNLASQYCDWVYLLDQGHLVGQGPPDTVLVPEILEPVYRVGVTRTHHHLHFERKNP